MVDPKVEIVEAKDIKTGGTRLIRRDGHRCRAGPLPGPPDPQGGRDGAGHRRRRGRLLRPGPGRRRRRAAQGALRPARPEIPIEGPGWVDSLVALLTDPYVSWILLFVGVFMLVIELKLPGIGLPGDHLGAGLPPVLLEPLPQRDRRPARDHPLPDRAGLPGAGALRLPRLRDLRDQRHPADALQHRAGQPHVHLADARLRVSRARV